MHRRLFLQLPLLAPAIATAKPPLVNLPISKLEVDPPKKAIVVRVGEDRTKQPFQLPDATFQVKVSGKDTEGRCVIFDTTRSLKAGPPLHLHTDIDEWFLVVAGEFKFQAGDETLRLKAGDSLLVPRGLPHAFIKISEGIAHLTIMHQPAGTMEEYLRTFSQMSDQSVASLRTLAEKHNTRVLGPPLKPD